MVSVIVAFSVGCVLLYTKIFLITIFNSADGDFHPALAVGDDHPDYSYSYLPAEDPGVETESDNEYA